MILKTPNTERPTSAEVAVLTREFSLLRRLQATGVVKAEALETNHHSMALVIEDFGGESLNKQFAGPVSDIQLFLRLAIEVTTIIGEIHEQGVIHKDINPSNIVRNAKTDIVKIIDFGISSELSRERQTVNPVQSLEGSLPYIAPEQTGRTNRQVDYRTDFYALGITFYQLLFGELPFRANDTIGWIYHHIATEPSFRTTRDQPLPGPLLDIIRKLLAKDMEVRYQSTHGILFDLRSCLTQWQNQGAIEHFSVGAHDIAEKFRIPQKLYGREQQVTALREAFDNVNAAQKEFVLVSGFTGIGKSVLVHEVQKEIVRGHGFFVEGKFEQYRRDIPYSAIVDSFRALAGYLLVEPENKLLIWQEKLASALGNNGRIITDLAPEFEQIIGKQAAIPPLTASETHTRFLFTLRDFIKVFTSSEHRLVIFLDDLQWSDNATLTLLEFLVMSEETGAFLLIGAYRDSEVRLGHPLPATLAAIERHRPIRRIMLHPLDRATLARLIADTLCHDVGTCGELAAIVHDKTQGNPFFVYQLLTNLYHERYLEYSRNEGGWHWNIDRIRQVEISDNVVTFLVGRLKELPVATQHSLRLAACIGNTFGLKMLSIIAEQPVTTTAVALRDAIKQEIIVPLSSRYEIYDGPLPLADAGETAYPFADDDLAVNAVQYQFQHDRVQQAAYALIDESVRKDVHYQIGRLLLKSQDNNCNDVRNVVTIVDHLNNGRARIVDRNERAELAELNLTAATLVKKSAAYQQALELLGIGLEILPPDSWSTRYDTAFRLHREYSECSYICGHFDQAEKSSEFLISRARTRLDQAQIYSMKMIQYMAAGRTDYAIDTGLKALKLLDMTLEKFPTDVALEEQYEQIEAILENRDIMELVDEPMISDPEKTTVMKILPVLMIAPYLVNNQNLWMLSALTAVHFSLRNGHTENTAYAYDCYGFYLGSIRNDYQRGAEFGKLAMALSERVSDMKSHCENIFTYTTLVHHWTHPWRTLSSCYQNVIKLGSETGNILYLAYACIDVILWDPNMDLDTAILEGERYLSMIEETRYQHAIDLAQIIQHRRKNMRGETLNRTSLSSSSFSESEALTRMEEARFFTGVTPYHLYKAEVCYHYEDYRTALEHIRRGDEVISAVCGQPYTVEFSLYAFLIYAALFSEFDDEQQESARARMKKEFDRMTLWAANCPENCRHRQLMMEAELARIDRNPYHAADCFDRAIQAVGAHGFMFEGALIHELAGKFYLAEDRRKLAGYYLGEAYYTYMRWGASAKARYLEERHIIFPVGGAVGVSSSAPTLPETTTELTLSTGSPANLDMESIAKAVRTLSGEVELDKLLRSYMAIVRENAGADREYILLREEGTDALLIQAESIHGRDLRVLQAEPFDQNPNLSTAVIQFVARSKESVIFSDANRPDRFAHDPYLNRVKPKSVLCMPILSQRHLLGILYLENSLISDAFAREQFNVLAILTAQAAISIRNAYLYATLEASVRRRTHELHEKNEELTQLNMDKNELMSIVVHDLKGPLSSIQGYADVITTSLDDLSQEQIARFLDAVKRSTKRMIASIRGLLDVDAIESGTMELATEEFDVRCAVGDVVKDFSDTAAAKEITLLPAGGEGTCEIAASQTALVRIVENLITNALKHAPRKSTISVSVEADDDFVFIKVSDAGPGLSQDECERVFHKYVRLDAGRSGDEHSSGLGLYIVRKLVDHMNGMVWCESDPGAGATFIVRLPKVYRYVPKTGKQTD